MPKGKRGKPPSPARAEQAKATYFLAMHSGLFRPGAATILANSPVIAKSAKSKLISMDDVRYPKGKSSGGGGASYMPIAVAAGDPYFANVKLLMGFEGANNSTGAPGMNDESSVARGTATVTGNAKISTTTPLYDGSSLLVDGSGDWISFPHSTDWVLTGKFTIELAVKLATFAGAVTTFIGHGGPTFYGWKLSVSNAGTVRFRLDNNADGTTDYDISSGAPISTIGLGTRYRLAVERDAANKIRLYIEGSMVASVAAASLASASTSNPLYIGSDNTLSTNGIIDEVRFTPGVARYASDSGYTPAASAFPRS